MNRGRLHPVTQTVGGVVVVLGGVVAGYHAFEAGNMFLGFLALAVMLGALVPLYPPDE